jgi:putative oxidoreductase
MATNSMAISSGAETRSITQGVVVLLGRFFFALIFLMAGANHFSKQTIGYAVSAGVPLSSIAVPLSGVLSIAGGLSILLGYRAKLGGWLIVLFLVPVTLMMHKFWLVQDPMMAQIQMILFMKNVAMLGGALLISQFGAGPFSLDARRSR